MAGAARGVIRVRDLSKAYGQHVVFEDAGFLMNSGERLGLVGRNGSGKTTLLRLLCGEEQPDSGTIEPPRVYRVGHLAQHLVFEGGSILEEVCSVLGERVSKERYRAEAALMGLGFSRDDLARPAREFSGGYQIRVHLARLLVDEPNLLLLDEPTNHLDIVALRWLVRFLRRWPNELILVTHDRQFMNSVTTHTMAVHRGRLRRMAGSVEKLYEQIRTEEEVYENTRRNEEKKRQRDQRFIERFRAKASKARSVQSRIKALDRRGQMEVLGTEQELSFRFGAAPFHASVMMTVNDLTFGFPGGPTLLEGLDLTVEKGDRVAVIGPNGRGKTTLLNLLGRELQPQRGRIVLNPNTRLAYFGQTNIDRLDPDRTIEEELSAAHPDASVGAVRSLCGLLMFSGDAALKKIGVLSGGERSRVLLGKLLASPSNLLLLDEPTNHLDMESVEGLLDAVDAFAGGVLLVTHSEMILERLATRLVVFDGGRAFLFEGGYRDFLDRIGWQAESRSREGKNEGAARTPRELRRLRAEVVSARGKATGPLKRRVEELEARIMRLEDEVKAHDENMHRAAEQLRNRDLARIAALVKPKRAAIEQHFAELETLSEELHRVRQTFDARLAELA